MPVVGTAWSGALGDDTGWPCVVGVTAAGEDFRMPTRAGKLKIWETGKLSSRPATQPTRFSGFQVFTHPPANPEILTNEPGRGGVGNVLPEPETV
jgi:hypothetical protein